MLLKQILFSFFYCSFYLTSNAQSIVGAGKEVDPYKYTIQKNKVVSKAAVVSAHPLASKVGVAVMKQGGNAFDAAIATQLVLAVVYPGAGNLGGGGFLVARTNNNKNIAIDYREKASANATRDMYLDANGIVLTDLSKLGHLAAGVPGTVAGLTTTHQYAKLPWAALVQPAIDIAEKGFILTEREIESLNDNRAEFTEYSTQTTAFVKTTLWKKGDTLFQPQLAATLKRIRDKGKAGFYEGETADLIVAEMKRGRGIISLTDLKSYNAVERTAIEFTYKKNYQIITMPPPSSGGVLINQMLNMLEKKNPAQLGFLSAKYIQLVTEVERRAYSDRANHLGDMDFYKVPLKTLTSKKYAEKRMKDYTPNIAGKSSAIKAGIIDGSEETTHLSVFDANGNAVAVTTTLNGGYGCKTIVGGAGFLLNNEMDDFSVKPGEPNMYGAVGGEANKIEPNKRMLSSMTPTIVLKNNKPFIVCGTPGGTTIITSVLQTILNIVDFNQTAKDAVNNPKFHHQWLPDEIFVERNMNAATIKQLEKMGYKVTPRGNIGRTEVIKMIGKNKMEIAADYRGDDAAEGY